MLRKPLQTSRIPNKNAPLFQSQCLKKCGISFKKISVKIRVELTQANIPLNLIWKIKTVKIF